MASILSHKFRMANDAGRNLGLAEVRVRLLKEELTLVQPSLPEEGEVINEIAEAEGILHDIHSRYLSCTESVKDAICQASHIDATTSDPAVRFETRANLNDLREKQTELKQERFMAEQSLRSKPGFASHRSVLALLLEAERDVDLLREELQELQAEHALAAATMSSVAEHTRLTLSGRIHFPRNPVPDDGKRCEMCDTGFPAGEFQTAPCGHYYHIFCLAIRVAMYAECCRPGCRTAFPPCWMRSFGFPSAANSESDTESIQDFSDDDDDSDGNGAILYSTSMSF